MICRADTVGVFQIESRAQMSMLPRLRPRCYYDLVIEVAIVRPGPIQGKMVHPYLRRRNGEEPVEYPSPDIERVLGRTLGVPLFQEQAMHLAIVAAGFTPGEADQLRRAMAAWKRKGHLLETFQERIVAGMTRRGYDESFAHRCVDQIKGFGEYGFPESHAASFALLVYASSWLKLHHPAAFAAALVNSQPMGFYRPAQIIRDASDHGVEVRPVDVNHSGWDCRLERRPVRGVAPDGMTRYGASGPAIRLGLRLVNGIGQDEASRLESSVARAGRFESIERLWRWSGVQVRTLRALARADAFGSMGLSRREALWQVQRLHDEHLPLFDGPLLEREGASEDPPAALPPLEEIAHVRQDYATTGLTLRAHPVSFHREGLSAQKVQRCAALKDERAWPNRRWIRVAGIVLVRQRPHTASGVVFMTIEDESGIANLILRPKLYERCRRVARHCAGIIASGRVERQGEVVHVMVHRLEDMTQVMPELSRDFR